MFNGKCVKSEFKSHFSTWFKKLSLCTMVNYRIQAVHYFLLFITAELSHTNAAKLTFKPSLTADEYCMDTFSWTTAFISDISSYCNDIDNILVNYCGNVTLYKLIDQTYNKSLDLMEHSCVFTLEDQQNINKTYILSNTIPISYIKFSSENTNIILSHTFLSITSYEGLIEIKNINFASNGDAFSLIDIVADDIALTIEMNGCLFSDIYGINGAIINMPSNDLSNQYMDSIDITFHGCRIQNVLAENGVILFIERNNVHVTFSDVNITNTASTNNGSVVHWICQQNVDNSGTDLCGNLLITSSYFYNIETNIFTIDLSLDPAYIHFILDVNTSKFTDINGTIFNFNHNDDKLEPFDIRVQQQNTFINVHNSHFEGNGLKMDNVSIWNHYRNEYTNESISYIQNGTIFTFNSVTVPNIIIQNSNFTHNAALYGAIFYIHCSRSIQSIKDTHCGSILLQQNLFYNNRIGGTQYDVTPYTTFGSLIYAQIHQNMEFSIGIEDCDFMQHHGNLIYLQESEYVYENANDLLFNTSVFNEDGYLVFIERCYFSDNTDSQLDANIGTILTHIGLKMIDVFISNSLFENNVCKSGSPVFLSDYATTLHINSSNFTGNNAIEYGIFHIVKEDAMIEISGCIFENNGYYQPGVFSQQVTILSTENNTYLSLNVTDSEFINNTNGNYGLFDLYSADINIKDSIFDSNIADYSSVVVLNLRQNGVLNIDGSLFKDNRQISGNMSKTGNARGLFYINEANVTVFDVKFIDNILVSTSEPNGIFVTTENTNLLNNEGSSITINSSRFARNKGASLFNYGQVGFMLKLWQTTFKNNNITQNGSIIFGAGLNAQIDINSCDFYYNGGGIHIIGPATVSIDNTNITQNKIIGNEAHSQGFLFGADVNLTINHVILEDYNNYSIISTGFGVLLHLEESFLTMENSAVLNFLSSSSIILVYKTTVQIMKSIFLGNEAGIIKQYSEALSSISFVDCIFDDNYFDNSFVFYHWKTVLFADCVFSENIIDGSLITITNTSASFINAEFVDNEAESANEETDVMVLLEEASDEFLMSNTSFKRNDGFESLLVEDGSNHNIHIQSSVFINNTFTKYLLHSLKKGSSLRIVSTSFGNLNLLYDNFEYHGNEVIIEMPDTILNKWTQFMRFEQSEHNDHSLKLYLDDNDIIVNETLCIFQYNKNNQAVAMIPCDIYNHNDMNEEHVHFDQKTKNVTVTELISEITVLQNKYCNQSTCHTKCDSLCVDTSFNTSDTNMTMVECVNVGSCILSDITIYNANIAAIKCTQDSSCSYATININNCNVFTLECMTSHACSDVQIMITNTTDAEISCYSFNSCGNIEIISDSNDIKFRFYDYSENVHITIPSSFNASNLQCDIHAHLNLQQEYFQSTVVQSILNLFDGHLSCDGIKYSFSSINTPYCNIKYNYIPQNDTTIMDYFLKDCVACTPLLYLSNISNTICYSTPYPSNSPTFAPSNSMKPTRYPTVVTDYDYYFKITYSIQSVTYEIQQLIINAPINVFGNITLFIEDVYKEMVSVLYRDFWLIINKVNNVKINDINKKLNSQSNQRQLKLISEIRCSRTYCKRLLVFDRDDQDVFESKVQIKINKYFDSISSTLNNSNILFSIDDNLQDITVQELYPDIPNFFLDPVVLSLFIFVGVMGIISILALLFNKQKIRIAGTNVIDNAIWLAPLFLSLQVWDFISDINLSQEMFRNHEFKSNGKGIVVSVCTIGSIVCIIIPYILNLIMAAKILTFTAKNETASTYYRNNIAIFVLMVCFCGSCYTAMQLTSSALFGINVLNSGLTKIELLKLGKVKLIGQVLIENIPQLIFQILYSVVMGQVSNNTYLSFIASSIQIIAAVLSYCITMDDTTNNILVQYKMYMEKMGNECFSTSEIQTILANKYKTETLEQAIAKVFAIDVKSIEISKNVITADQEVQFQVFQWVNEEDMEQFDDNKGVSAHKFITKLFKAYETQIHNTFTTHFELNPEISKFEISVQTQDQKSKKSALLKKIKTMQMNELLPLDLSKNKSYSRVNNQDSDDESDMDDDDHMT
eukprot:41787_1